MYLFQQKKNFYLQNKLNDKLIFQTKRSCNFGPQIDSLMMATTYVPFKNKILLQQVLKILKIIKKTLLQIYHLFF